jgi:hypothetical protein
MTQMSVRTTDDKEPWEVAPQPPEEPVQIASGRVKRRGRLTRRMSSHRNNGRDLLREVK